MTFKELYNALSNRYPDSLRCEWDNDGIMCASDLHLKYKYKQMAKEVAMKALEEGCAFVNSPASNDYLNKYFSLTTCLNITYMLKYVV